MQGEGVSQIAQGSTVEFQVAGECGLGVARRCHAEKVFGIGVDADQWYLGAHVMSALKRVDVAVNSAIRTPRRASCCVRRQNVTFGAKVNGVGIGRWSPRVSAPIKAAVATQLKLELGDITGIRPTVK